MRKFAVLNFVIVILLALVGCGDRKDSATPTPTSTISSGPQPTTTTSAKPVIGHYAGLVPQEGALEGMTRDASGMPTCSAGYDSVNLIMNADVLYGQMSFYSSIKEGGNILVIDYKRGIAANIKAVIVNGIAFQLVPGEGNPASKLGAIIMENEILQGRKVSSIVLCMTAAA